MTRRPTSASLPSAPVATAKEARVLIVACARREQDPAIEAGIDRRLGKELFVLEKDPLYEEATLLKFRQEPSRVCIGRDAYLIKDGDPLLRVLLQQLAILAEVEGDVLLELLVYLFA